MNIIYSGYELSGVGKIANFFAEHKVIFGEVQFARFLLVLQLGSLGLFICRFIPHPRSITVTWKNRSGFFSYRPLSLETGGGVRERRGWRGYHIDRYAPDVPVSPFREV